MTLTAAPTTPSSPPGYHLLRAGQLEVAVLPEVGGSIAYFDLLDAQQPHGRQHLLRAANGPYTDVLEAACFPLVPYVNRIRGGSFQCDAQVVRLPRNLPGDASPLHGQGWRAAWQVAQVGQIARAASDHISLVYRHTAGHWPWDYEAHQHIRLTPDCLEIVLECRNLSAAAMPCGLGLHPYFPCTFDTLLDTQVTSVWTVDADVLPVAKQPATGHYLLQQRQIGGQQLDNGYGGWAGRARIDWPGQPASLEMSSPDAAYFQVYSPAFPSAPAASNGFFAAEPVQHANAALNAPQGTWPELGIYMLAQGESRQLVTRFLAVPARR